MKLTYRRCGDYYLPNIGVPAEDMHPLILYEDDAESICTLPTDERFCQVISALVEWVQINIV